MDMHTLAGLFGSLSASSISSEANRMDDAGSASTSFLAAVKKMQAAQSSMPEKSLELTLKEIYSPLFYHVLDKKEGWEREDYPHQLLFQPTLDANDLEGHALEREAHSLFPGSKAVVVPSALEKKMIHEPEYAVTVKNQIEDWFAGGNDSDCQCVLLGEEGTVVCGCFFARAAGSQGGWEKADCGAGRIRN